MDRDYSYFQKGVRHVMSESSDLSSSSKYLNHPSVRDWLATNLLRRNGPDLPISSDPTRGLSQALSELRDMDEIQDLLDAEKAKNPAFRDWLEERWLSELTMEDFAKFPEKSFGGRYYKNMIETGISLNFGWTEREPQSDFEYIRMRFGQTHDFEHLMTGGGFNSLGELLPYFMRLSNPYTHLSPELATELGAIYIFGANRLTFRSYLHYPETWLTTVDLMRRGLDVGMNSDPFILMRYEDALHLSVPEAREMLGVRNAEDVDTEAASRIFAERDARGSLAVEAAE